MDSAGDIGQFLDGLSCIEAFDYLHRLSFSHAIDQKIGLGIEDDGLSNLVGPVVIMTESSQRCFQPPYDDRNITAVGLLGQGSIDQCRSVGAKACFAPWTVLILASDLLVGSIVGYHAIDIPSADHTAESGFSHFEKIFG